MNPLCGTVGGVVGPVVAYLAFIYIFCAAGLMEGFEYEQSEPARIPRLVLPRPHLDARRGGGRRLVPSRPAPRVAALREVIALRQRVLDPLPYLGLLKLATLRVQSPRNLARSFLFLAARPSSRPGPSG